MSNLLSKNSIVINHYGGNTGGEFAPNYIKSLAINSGDLVDAIIINDQKHGGDGGGASSTLVFDSDEYISKVLIRSGIFVDHLEFTTNKGRTIGGGGTGGTETVLTNIRVIAIGGRSGIYLDQIQITYVEDYIPSFLVEENAQFVIDFTPPNTVLKEYSETTDKTIDSYEKVTESMQSQEYTSSIEAEYFAKVALNTSIKYVNTELTTVRLELNNQLVSGKYSETTIKDGQVGVLLVNGTILKNSENQTWMYPTSKMSYAVISISDYKNVLNHYDLTGQLDVQMPKLLKHKIRQNGYTFFEE